MIQICDIIVIIEKLTESERKLKKLEHICVGIFLCRFFS